MSKIQCKRNNFGTNRPVYTMCEKSRVFNRLQANTCQSVSACYSVNSGSVLDEPDIVDVSMYCGYGGSIVDSFC